MKVLAVGPESSGTKLLAELFSRSMGKANVIHRSFPYGRLSTGAPAWPRLADLDFDVAVVVTRDAYAAALSQVENNHANSVEVALERIEQAYWRIFLQLRICRKRVLVTSYESLILQDKAFASLCSLVGANPPPSGDNPVRDANAKYYGGEHFRDQRPVEDRV